MDEDDQNVVTFEKNVVQLKLILCWRFGGETPSQQPKDWFGPNQIWRLG